MKDHQDRIGQQIGDYRLLRWLGDGSFGDVYLGEHVRNQTQAAVKVLQTRLTSREELEKFINEARTMRLKHPHIVPVLDFGIAYDDTPFLVMAYAPHGTLRDRHPKGSQLPLSTVISYTTPLASALQYAHSLRLIHRDVKPENMLVGPQSEILLSDFGIATIAHSSRSLSSLQQNIEGTLSYMAPEQIMGLPQPASDQYALGVVVYEWLCGKCPFEGTTVELATQHSALVPPSLREQIPTLSAEVEQVVLTALAKDPKQRFATIEEFAAALEIASRSAKQPGISLAPTFSATAPTALQLPGPDANAATENTLSVQPAALSSHEETLPSAIPPGNNLRSLLHVPVRSRRGRTALLILLVLLLLVSGIGFYVSGRVQTTAKTPTAADRYAEFVAAHGTMFGFNAQHTFANPYEQILTVKTVTGLKLYWTFQAGNDIDASPTLANGLVYVGSTDGTVYALDTTTREQKWSFSVGATNVTPTVVNDTVYVGSTDGNVYALDATTGKQKWSSHVGGANNITPTVVSGIAYVYAGGYVYALNAATGKQKWSVLVGGNTIDDSPVVVNSTVYIGVSEPSNPDGGFVYGYVFALDAATGQQKWPPFHVGAGEFTLAVANNIVYMGGEDGRVYALDAITGKQKWLFPLPLVNGSGEVFVASLAVTNNAVYVGDVEGDIYALDAYSGQMKWPFHPSHYDNQSIWIFVANGVVYAGYEGNIYGLDATTGVKKWSFGIGGSINASPTVVNGVVYVGSTDHTLYAFHLASA